MTPDETGPAITDRADSRLVTATTQPNRPERSPLHGLSASDSTQLAGRGAAAHRSPTGGPRPGLGTDGAALDGPATFGLGRDELRREIHRLMFGIEPCERWQAWEISRRFVRLRSVPARGLGR